MQWSSGKTSSLESTKGMADNREQQIQAQNLILQKPMILGHKPESADSSTGCIPRPEPLLQSMNPPPNQHTKKHLLKKKDREILHQHHSRNLACHDHCNPKS